MSDNLVGANINGYYFEKRIGSGGFSTIYLATKNTNNLKVAVKVVQDSQSPVSNQSKILEREADILAKLNHPHIVKFHDYFCDAERAYLVMDYLEGGSLRDHMLIYDLLITEVVRIAYQITSALEHIHSCGYIHRDIKPENILFDRDGNAVLVDFGIAYDLAKDKQTDSNDLVLGSPHYFPPEQLKRMFISYGDIYSFGIMLYELLAYQLPFKNESIHALLRHHLLDDLPLLPDSCNLPSELNRILKIATTKNPLQRYESAVDIAIDLDSVIYYYRHSLNVYPSISDYSDTFSTQIIDVSYKA